MKQLHILYIPGLGAARPPIQNLLIKLWPLWGVKIELFEIDWGNDESWDVKLKRLLDRIDEVAASDGQVGLVAASAGASAALNAFAVRPAEVSGVVIIAGMVNQPQDIQDKYRRKNPAFVTAAYAAEESLRNLKPADRRRILSVYAVWDEIVNKKYSRIDGAHNRISPTIGHVLTIGFQLIAGAPRLVHFLKRKSKYGAH